MDLGQRSASADTNDGTQFVSSSVPERVLGGGRGRWSRMLGGGREYWGGKRRRRRRCLPGGSLLGCVWCWGGRACVSGEGWVFRQSRRGMGEMICIRMYTHTHTHTHVCVFVCVCIAKTKWRTAWTLNPNPRTWQGRADCFPHSCSIQQLFLKKILYNKYSKKILYKVFPHPFVSELIKKTYYTNNC